VDNSASERELAEELIATKVRVQDLEMQIEDLSDRIGNLVSQLGKLTKVVKQMMTNGIVQPSGADSAQNYSSTSGEIPPPSRNSDAAAATVSPDIPAELVQVIRLVTENKSEEAQKIIATLPRTMLLAHQGIVALVAGAVRIRKSEFDVAAKALQKARSLIGDPKLLRVVKYLENQLPG
jgi:hypothetical protein